MIDRGIVLKPELKAKIHLENENELQNIKQLKYKKIASICGL